MADGRKNNGGFRKGAGRKPKTQVSALIEKFDRLIDEDEVIKSMYKLIKNGDTKALRLYLNYKYGQPHKTVDITSGDAPLQNFNLNKLTDKELNILLKAYEKNAK